MKLDPNDFQCVNKLAVSPSKADSLAVDVLHMPPVEFHDGKDIYEYINPVIDQMAQELSYKLGQSINALMEATSGAAVPPIILDTNKLWEDKIDKLEKELQHAIDTNAENKSFLAAELAAKKLSFTKLQIQQKKTDIENAQLLADAKQDKANQAAYWAELQQKVSIPTGTAMDKFNLGVYSPNAEARVQASKDAAKASTQSTLVNFYEKKFVDNLKAQTTFTSSGKAKPFSYSPASNISQGLKKKVLVDDAWDDEEENTQLKFLQKIGMMSNLNVSPQSRIMRSTGTKTMVHRLLCDKCKEAIPAESDWIDGYKSEQPEIVEFCKAHRHVEAKEEEGRKFRG